MNIKVKGFEIVYRDTEGNLQEHFMIADPEKHIEKKNAGEFVEGCKEVISARMKTRDIPATPEQLEALINN